MSSDLYHDQRGEQRRGLPTEYSITVITLRIQIYVDFNKNVPLTAALTSCYFHVSWYIEHVRQWQIFLYLQVICFAFYTKCILELWFQTPIKKQVKYLLLSLAPHDCGKYTRLFSCQMLHSVHQFDTKCVLQWDFTLFFCLFVFF